MTEFSHKLSFEAQMDSLYSTIHLDNFSCFFLDATASLDLEYESESMIIKANNENIVKLWMYIEYI